MGGVSCLFTLSLSYVDWALSWLAYVKMSRDSTYAVIACNNFASWIFSNMFDLAKSFVKILASKTLFQTRFHVKIKHQNIIKISKRLFMLTWNHGLSYHKRRGRRCGVVVVHSYSVCRTRVPSILTQSKLRQTPSSKRPKRNVCILQTARHMLETR